MDTDAMLDLGFSQIMQGRLPYAHLIKHIGHGFRNQDMAGIAAVHHPLRDVDAAAGHVECGIDVFHSIHRAGMNSHAQVKLWPSPQGAVKLQSAAHRGFHIAKKTSAIPSPVGRGMS